MFAAEGDGERGAEGAGWTDADRQLLARFGSNVRRHRKEQGRSIAALANEAGLDASYLGELERGRKNVSLLTAARISLALDILVQALLEER
ncbi:MAG: helix-turn-helix domain-containing protein [Gemmatimonadaceae bacterium]|nr:helix-turn-helix domain-containing protein [Gemmatimonadaceae bacterium]